MKPLIGSGYSLKSVALGVLSIFLFLCLPGTFAWSAEGPGNVKWKQNEVLYRLISTAGAGQTNVIRSESDADIDDEIAEIEFDSIRHLRSRSKSTEELIQRLMRNPHVLYAEPNYIITINKTPNDPSYGDLWGLPMISAPLAWDVTTGTGEVVVGVVDSGVDYNHPDLAPNIWSNPGVINGCPQGTHGFNAITKTCDPMDDHNHGTHVSGTIGAVGNNGTGVVGVNWTTKIMGLKWLGSDNFGFLSDALAAIDWAVTAKQAGVNVRVLNNSWSLFGPVFSQALLDVINKAADWDILFVASAMNDNTNIDVTPVYPASYVASNLISVAATTSTDNLASFSNYGATKVHLGAPGESILSTTRNNTYSYFSGTSMAAPHVSGAAALILSSCSQATASGLKSLILSNVDPLPSLSGKVSTGGRLNVNKANQTCPVPLPPINLSVTAVSSSQINLTWTDQSTSETGFQIERKTGAGGTYALIVTTAANATTYSNSGLAEGTTYFYRVRAVNSYGNSAYSNEASAMLVSPPPAPTLSATAVSSSQINLTWTDQSNNETGFQIERKTGTGGTYALIVTTAANATTYSNSGLAGGTTYFYRVRAVNSAGNSAYSNEASATTQISPPANLFATAVSSSQINLTWTDQSNNETGFQIERKTGTGGTYALIVTTAANATTYSNSGLAEGTTYFYRVRAVNSAGNSAYSNEASATPVSPPPPPINLFAVPVSSSEINLTWTDQSTNETGFQIERKTGIGGTYALIGTAAANATTYNSTGLADGTTYYYQVRAVNSAGNSAYTNQAATTTPISTPANLSATAVSSSQINLTWTDQSTSETGFRIERKTGAGGTYAQIGTVAANATAYNDSGLAEGTMYFYRVRALGNLGNSAASNEASATTISPPPPPSNLFAVPVSSSEINLTWTDQSTNETGFRIERKTGAGGTYTLIVTTAANATTYSDTGLADETTYFYRVQAVNSAGNSTYSNEASATTPVSPPAAPATLSATAVSSSQINLTWTDQSTNETGFQIERKTGAGGTYAQIGTAAANATTYNSTGLADVTTYFYRVRAVNSAGNSAYSNEASTTTPSSGTSGGGGGGGGCSIAPEGKSKGESPLGTMLALFSPGVFLIVRKKFLRKLILL